MNIQPSIDLKKVNLQTAVGYLVSLHENEYQWNLLGVRVVGVAPTEADIPEGTYEYGDAYEVGTEPPYNLYIYTRPDGVVHTEGYWFNTGKFPMPGPQGPKGDGIEQINKWTNGSVSNVTYNTTDGAKVTQTTTVDYTDTTDGSTKHQQFGTTTTLPIVPGKYISMDATSDNKKMEVKVDDTELALDFIKIDKTSFNYIPWWYDGTLRQLPASAGADGGLLAVRLPAGQLRMTECMSDTFSTTAGNNKVDFYALYNNTVGTEFSIDKTPTDTGTLTTTQLSQLYGTVQANNRRIIYDGQAYIRMDPTNAPDGTLNYIHIDSIEDGNGGYKAIGKCFSITVSTREWQVVELDFGGTTRTTHNLTLFNSSADTTVYFSLTNNRPETYEGAPAGLWSALENSPIACTVNNAGTYSAGMITVDGDNFKVMYGNSEEMTIIQPEMVITDSLV